MTRAEMTTLGRFAVSGMIVAGAYVAAYTLLLRTGLPQLAANAAAFFGAVCLQYALQAGWTFRRPLRAPAQASRFACTIGFGWLTASLVTAAGAGLGQPAWIAAGAAAALLPLQNYLFFRLWVFTRSGPELEHS